VPRPQRRIPTRAPIPVRVTGHSPFLHEGGVTVPIDSDVGFFSRPRFVRAAPGIRLSRGVESGGNIPALGFVPTGLSAAQSILYDQLLQLGIPPQRARSLVNDARLFGKTLGELDSILSGAGEGAAAGFAIGAAAGAGVASLFTAPIGAGIGAVVGGIAGAFGGGSKPSTGYRGEPPRPRAPVVNLPAIASDIAQGIDFGESLANQLGQIFNNSAQPPRVDAAAPVSEIPQAPAAQPYYYNPSTEVIPSVTGPGAQPTTYIQGPDEAAYRAWQAAQNEGMYDSADYDRGYAQGQQMLAENRAFYQNGGQGEPPNIEPLKVPGIQNNEFFDQGWRDAFQDGGHSLEIPRYQPQPSGERYQDQLERQQGEDTRDLQNLERQLSDGGGNIPLVVNQNTANQTIDKLNQLERQLNDEIAREQQQDASNIPRDDIPQQIAQIENQIQQFRQLENQPASQRDIPQELQQKNVLQRQIQRLKDRAKQIATQRAVRFCMRCESQEDALKFLNGEVGACNVDQRSIEPDYTDGGQRALQPPSQPMDETAPMNSEQMNAAAQAEADFYANQD
jgi:hypothetical protein